jgi:hypothetical protein
MLQRLQTYYLIAHNSFDFTLRQLFRWRRGGLKSVNESKADLYAHLPPKERMETENIAARLKQEYHLEQFYNHSCADNYRENLFYIKVLEEALQKSDAALPDPVHVADIGPSTWFYVHGLYAFLKSWQSPAGRELHLSGYECDPYRVYADLYSRYDHAQANLTGLPNVTYVPQPFKAHLASFELILMLFPFVFQEDHLKWGLPGGMFTPEGLFQAAWVSLKPGGWLLIVNQGEAEHAAQKAMLENNGIQWAAAFRFETPLFHYDIPRFVIVAQRNGNL